MRALCDAAGVEVSMVTCHPDYTNPDPAARAGQVEDMARNIALAVENHTKSFFWQHFDFAQQSQVFLRIVDGLRDSSVGINFDSANPLVAGEDPLPIFEQVKERLAI